MELDARRFYEVVAQKSKDASIRKLLGDLAQEEQRHETVAQRINEKQAADGEVDIEEEVGRRLFVLRIVQPALAGLMDGSVSTLARFLRRRLLPAILQKHLRSGLRRPSVPVLAWVLPKLCLTTANSAAAGPHGCAGPSAG